MTIKSATIRMPQRRSYGARRPRRGRSVPRFNIFDSSLRGLLTFLLLAIFLGLSFVASYKVKMVANDINALEKEYAATQKENRLLEGQLQKMTSKATLAKIGRRLGLRAPAESQVITLPE